jgi:hypothetical protein
MPFDIDEFTRLRPYVFHVSDRTNLPALRSTRRLRTAANLIRSANRPEWLVLRRTDPVHLATPDGLVVLKDQRPLIAANMVLTAEWSLGEFVQYLNSFTYFWPGNDRGPSGPGQRLLDHYQADGPVLLRIATEDLLRANASMQPEFCPFNSGAPRYHSGRRAVRGPHLFKPAAEFPRRASEVVELAFRGDVALPSTTLIRSAGGWANLFERGR